MAYSGLNISGIYKIESKVHPERIYIGSALNMRVRRNNHFLLLKKNKHKNAKLQANYNKYGANDLTFHVLAICDKKDITPVNNVVWLEQFLIDAYKPWFNIAKIAGSSTGIKRSEETKQKQKGNKNGVGNKGNTGGIPWNKGMKGVYKMPEESVEKRASKMRGRKRPPFTEEWLHNLSEAGKKRKDSDETKRKKSEKLTGRPVSQETRDKIGNAHRGKIVPPLTEEGRTNLSNAITEWWKNINIERNVGFETERYFRERRSA